MHDLESLHARWVGGDAVEVGRLIMTPLAPAERVSRAVAVLELCRGHWRSVPAIEVVLAIAATSARWREAHGAFQRVRELTLQEEKLPSSDAYSALLFVAENAAKTIYNASGQPAPFDDDSPWWLASNILHFADTLRDPTLRDALWHAFLGSPPPRPAPAARVLDEESELIRKLVMTNHLSNAERARLPQRHVRGSSLTQTISDIFEQQGRFPAPALGNLSMFDGGRLDPEPDGSCRLSWHHEVALGRFETVSTHIYPDGRAAAEALARKSWPISLDGIAVDWTS